MARLSIEWRIKMQYKFVMGTSKNRFEKGKWVEYAECEESRRSKAVCLTRRCNTMLQSEITGDGMDAVASEISLVE